MSIFKFTRNILEGKLIDVFNNGKHERDFTYVSDVCSAIFKLVNKKLKKKQNKFEIFNIGNSKHEKLTKLMELLEILLKKNAKRNYLGLQMGDVKKTFSNISLLNKKINFRPKVKLKNGLKKFINWYKKYYKVKIN